MLKKNLPFLTSPITLGFLVVILCIIIQYIMFKVHPFAGLGLACATLAGVFVFINYKYLWYAGIIFMPLSINMEQLGSGVGLSFPCDLITVALFIIFWIRAKKEWSIIKSYSRHPMIIIVMIYLIWMLVTTFSSSMPIISLKYFLSSFWYFTAYFLASVFFFRNKSDLKNWLWYLAPTLVGVVLFTIYKHAQTRFDFYDSYTIMEPFYKEHTAYGASIAIPTIAYILMWLHNRFSIWQNILVLSIIFTMVIGVITCYTRGAWLGIMGGLAVYFALISWIRYRLVSISVATITLLIGIIVLTSNPNYKQDGNKNKSLDEQFYSILNTKTDLSNQERINRWVAAWEMLQERPLIGFGPGTYAMQYAPYQKAGFRTTVSTNQGDMGTAHNEFLLAGAEMGWMGVFLIFLIFCMCIFYGIKGVVNAPDSEIRILYATAICGLLTYFIHSIVNNFLDQDKVAIPVYLCMAQIVALDVFYKSRKTEDMIKKR